MIRTLFRYFLRTIAGIISFVLLWLIAALVFPFISSGYIPAPQNNGIAIFIESNGVHTDFVVPVKTQYCDWSTSLPYSDFEIAGPDYGYVAIGWGDKGFFIGTPTWSDLKFSTAFNAAFGLSSTAMHVTYKRFQPKEGENCRRIELSPLQYRVLIWYIKSSFQVKNRKFIAIDHPGYSDHDCFYEAKGTYSLFQTCNVWTGNGLKYTGIKTGAWTPLARGVLQNLDPAH